MDRHDERDTGLAVERPRQHEVFFSERRDHGLSQHDREGFERTRKGALYLAESDMLAPELQAEAVALSQLPLHERLERIDQRTAELGAAFVQNVALHPMDTSLGAKPMVRMLGLQVVENRVAILERREGLLLVPCVGLGAPAVFDGRLGAVLFDKELALGPLRSSMLAGILFHEQSHNMQRAAMENPRAFPQFDERLIGSWIDNAREGEYQRSGVLASEHFAYEYQPIERFAFAREENLMKRMYEYLEKQP